MEKTQESRSFISNKTVPTDSDSVDEYLTKKYDLIPLSSALIDHVRRIDGFNEDELCILKKLITSCARKVELDFKFSDASIGDANSPLRKFVETLLKVHQIFALVDVSFEPVLPTKTMKVRAQNLPIHYHEIVEQLMEHDGLNYVPRERSTDGRVFEHAADSKSLIDHLIKIDDSDPRHNDIVEKAKASSDGPLAFFVRVNQEPLNVKDTKSIDDSIYTKELELVQKYEKRIFSELGITEDNILIDINKAYLELTMKANGKADLYFHAYMWDKYLRDLQKKYDNSTEKPDDFEKIQLFATNQYPFIQRLIGLSSTLAKVNVNVRKYPFNEESYKKQVKEFANFQNPKKQQHMEQIQRALFVAQISDDQEALFWIEKLLVQLQGYCDMNIRDQVVVLLNMLYDGVDWQLPEAFRPVVRCVGQHFVISLIVHKKPGVYNDKQLYLGLGAPSPSEIKGNNAHLLTWHKIEPRNILSQDNVQAEININFGKFWKCGFYDWRVVSISNEGKLSPLEIIGKPEPQYPTVHDTDYGDQYEEDEEVGSLAQGRFIVHARGMRDHSFHEVQVDLQDAKVDKTENTFIQRGNFRDVAANMSNYQSQGITALYLMGTLERDNYPFKSNYQGVQYRKEDASPLAAIDRATTNKMLGGDEGMNLVMQEAKRNKVKVICDSLARISSSRFNRKYKSLLMHYLDEDGRRHICYGTDGQAQKYDDTCMLNYRKLEAWELLIDEIVEYTQKFGLDGIHLDNGQAWPQIMEPDVEELTRIDVDGKPAYSSEDFLNGEIVIRNENFGYWNTNNMETYANPFFVKLCKKLWLINPDFMILGECWGGFKFEHRQIILARSGVIPRLYRLPITLSSLFGKRLSKDGSIEKAPVDTVIAVKKWYENSRRFLPNGTVLLQSSTSHSLPYPAYLYGKGTWAAIDILFFMPDQPITLMGELDGEIYRVGEQRTVFQHEQAELGQGTHSELKRTNSQIMRALHGVDDEEDEKESETTKASNSPVKPIVDAEQRRGLPKVRSGVNIGVNYVEAQEGQLHVKEQKFKAGLAPEEGFDLSKVNTHYMHRRRLRKEKMALRYGEMVMLAARDERNQFISDVLVYARYSLSETLIIATSICDHSKKIFLDVSQLLPTFKRNYANNTVVMIKNVISDAQDPEYYFLREFIELKTMKMLPAYRSLMISVTICDDDQFIFKKCLTNSIERTKRNLVAHKSIETEQISLLFSDCIEHDPTNIARFANVIGSIQHSFLDKLGVSFRDLFVNNRKLSDSVELTARLTAMTGYLIKQAGGQVCAPTRAAKSMNESNILGPIVFCTPELGRWSTVGGLGVMVDELSIGLADLGQDVYVISPYYERNRKGATGYLAQDPAGIVWKENVHVNIGCGYTLGVHEGLVKGVKVIFLHNGDIFPSPYPDAKPDYLTTQISVFGKGCLEFCCARGIIPAMMITNDWFTGLIAAYAKIGAFGDTFKGSCFLHICHNLQESYEGRIHLDPVHGGLETLHQLPREWLIDPQWKNVMINPSRCALMMSDQWATVSKSYREDLLNSSSLSWLLRQKPEPFAYPNGIPIQERIRRLDKAAPDHLTAKKKLQQKYFNFGDLDDSIPMFAFVGRVVAQKGVLLIMDVAEHIIHKFEHKVQFLIGGPANMNDPYAAQCAHRMWALKAKYPHCFWAAPEEFFTDGSLVNRGADFGLMPSVFEPGGIVQHEFFVGATPVVAFKTGGLKDSVIEFLWDSEVGSGYTFESHTSGDLIFALERAVGTFRNKPKYLKLRENAFKATMCGDEVSRAWLSEFYRLSGKIFVDYTIVNDLNSKFPEWSPADYIPISIIQEIFGSEKRPRVLQDLDHGAEDEKNQADASPDRLMEIDNVMSAFDQAAYNKKPKTFAIHNRGPRHNCVEICGSFDDWQVRHEMTFDPFTNQWFVTIHLKPNQDFFYKYILNSDNWIVNDEEEKIDDGHGNVNNVCRVMI